MTSTTRTTKPRTSYSGQKSGVMEIAQDEGLLTVQASVEKNENYATRIKVEFKAYDVFTEKEPSAKDTKHPDYIQDWGLPKGKGTFHFYMPANWK